MPVINIDCINASQEQKEELMKEFTKTASRILNVPEQFFYVIVNSHTVNDFGVNGKTFDKFIAELQASNGGK